MKKVFILILVVFFYSGSAFGGEFEDNLKIAKQGNHVAQWFVGYAYEIGEGVAQNYKQAVYWYTKAAEQGYAKAQNNLGFMYRTGKGVTQDYKQAFYWDKKAAEQGNVDAQFNLAIMYYNGIGTTQNYKKAYIWESLAAAQGHTDAALCRDITAKKYHHNSYLKLRNLLPKCKIK